ncbi:MAG: hypothetical protein SFW36_23770 [Leptolyngbyaceae cyanobacterium bins.59]|nr:hypothetical protein [Leptolyngbyaceae cyanobacterium bins.59]
MKFLNRKLANLANSTQNPSGEEIAHQEPKGHLHEQYRHWSWLKSPDQRAQ